MPILCYDNVSLNKRYFQSQQSGGGGQQVIYYHRNSFGLDAAGITEYFGYIWMQEVRKTNKGGVILFNPEKGN